MVQTAYILLQNVHLWRMRASIPLPRACEARALPFELIPHDETIQNDDQLCVENDLWTKIFKMSARRFVLKIIALFYWEDKMCFAFWRPAYPRKLFSTTAIHHLGDQYIVYWF